MDGGTTFEDIQHRFREHEYAKSFIRANYPHIVKYNIVRTEFVKDYIEIRDRAIDDPQMWGKWSDEWQSFTEADSDRFRLTAFFCFKDPNHAMRCKLTINP